MAVFLKKLVMALSALIALLVLVFLLSKVFLYHTTVIRCEQPLKWVVVGNSHPATAFNDSLIPGFLNAARGGEWYLHSYVKLKRILKDNPTIDTVFVELDELIMFKKTDRLLWRDNSLGVYYNYNSPLFGLDEEWVIIENNPLGYLENIPMNIRVGWRERYAQGINLAKSPQIFSIANRVDSSCVDSALIFKETQMSYRPKSLKFNRVNLAYIEKIKSLCESQGITVVFIRCPVHHAYEGRRYEKQFQEFRATYFANDVFFDFKDFQVSDNYFKDLDHFNKRGADAFTLYFKEHMIKTKPN